MHQFLDGKNKERSLDDPSLTPKKSKHLNVNRLKKTILSLCHYT